MLGRYGEAVDAASTNGSFIQVADFNFGYQPISGNYPSASPGVNSVLAGDTLKSIAQGAYGDGKLWYRIAEANGLSGDSDLRVGQVLNVPSGVGSIHNDGSVFKPYDPTKITGDTTPNLPVPAQKGGCGGIGTLIMVAVAVVATIFTAGAAAAAMGGATFSGSMAAGSAALAGGAVTGGAIGAGAFAIGGAVGSIISQGVGIAIGAQDSFSWKGVALSAVGSGIAGGLSGSTLIDRSPVANAVARGALVNATTQGVAVVTGLQEKFSWRAVAASAVGAGVGAQMGRYLSENMAPSLASATNDAVAAFATRAATGLAAGTMAAIARGGRVSVQQVATDAFGNALGSSIAEALPSKSQNFTSAFIQAASQPLTRQAGIQIADSGMIFSDAGSSTPVLPEVTVRASKFDSDPYGLGGLTVADGVVLFGQIGRSGSQTFSGAAVPAPMKGWPNIPTVGIRPRPVLGATAEGVDVRKSAAEMIPTDGYYRVAPNSSPRTGVIGNALDILDDFNNSPVGLALQGLPPEGAALSGVKAGLMFLGTTLGDASKIAAPVADGLRVSRAAGDAGGKIPVRLYDVMTYGQSKAGEVVGDALTGDHLPSIAAVQMNVEKVLNRTLTRNEYNVLRNNTNTVIVGQDLHEAGRTYFRANTSAKISEDAGNIVSAALKDQATHLENAPRLGYDAVRLQESFNALNLANEKLFVNFATRKSNLDWLGALGDKNAK